MNEAVYVSLQYIPNLVRKRWSVSKSARGEGGVALRSRGREGGQFVIHKVVLCQCWSEVVAAWGGFEGGGCGRGCGKSLRAREGGNPLVMGRRARTRTPREGGREGRPALAQGPCSGGREGGTWSGD